jgi:hypothetical protein
MSENLFLVQSSNTQALLKQGKKLKFIGQGIDFQTYQNGDNSVLTLKNSTIEIPEVNSQDLNIDFDMILYGSTGRSVRGKINGRIGEIFVQKLGDVAKKLDKSRTGQFELSNIQNGIYSFFNQSNPSMKTDVAVVTAAKTNPDLTNPNDPVFDKLKNQVPEISKQDKRFPWSWHFNLKLALNPDPGLKQYTLNLVDDDNDWKIITYIEPNKTTYYISDDETNVELYNSSYTAILTYPVDYYHFVQSHIYWFAFP